MARPPKAMLRIVEWIATYKEEHDGNSPTFEVIAENFDIANSTAWSHVDRARRYGLLEIDEHGGINLMGEYRAPEGDPATRMIPPRRKRKSSREKKVEFDYPD